MIPATLILMAVGALGRIIRLCEERRPEGLFQWSYGAALAVCWAAFFWR